MAAEVAEYEIRLLWGQLTMATGSHFSAPGAGVVQLRECGGTIESMQGKTDVAETAVLPAKKRTGRGSQFAKQLRLSGFTPAILYGHGQDSVSLSIPTETIEAAVRHGAHLVKLSEEVNEDALVKEIQWNALGTRILHVDFTRVDMTESVKLTLPLELRGVAPGTKQGGVVEQLVREVQIECQVSAIPEKLQLSINELELDATLTEADIELPSGAKFVDDPTRVVVQCVTPKAVDEELETPAEAGAEPEVIGGSKDEPEGSGGD